MKKSGLINTAKPSERSVFRIEGLPIDYLEYFFPGILAMVVLFTAVFATMSVIEDRQRGFLQQVMVVPGSRASFVLGKTAGVTTMALVQCLLCVLAAPAAGISLGGIHWPLLLLSLTLGCIGLTAVNFAMAWVINSTAGYHAIMGVLLLPLWIVSGAMFPPSGNWVGPVMAANPMSYLVDATRHSLYGGSAPVSQAGLGASLGVLGGFALVGVAFTVWFVDRRSQGGRA